MMLQHFEPPARGSSPTNRHFWYSLATDNTTKVWRLWVDVANWKTWDSGLQDAYIDEPFTLGATGTIVAKNGRKTLFEVVEFIPEQAYTIKTNLPLGALFVRRAISHEQFTHEVWFAGLSRGIFSRLFGPSFRSMLPSVVESVKKLSAV